jgi:hypothetical protein
MLSLAVYDLLKQRQRGSAGKGRTKNRRRTRARRIATNLTRLPQLLRKGERE